MHLEVKGDQLCITPRTQKEEEQLKTFRRLNGSIWIKDALHIESGQNYIHNQKYARLYDLYNGTSASDENGDLQLYQNWLEDNLLKRIDLPAHVFETPNSNFHFTKLTDEIEVKEPIKVEGYSAEFVSALIDRVWNEATESETVPSSALKQRLIKQVTKELKH